MSQVKITFSKKQKILLAVTIPLALFIHYWVTSSQEIAREVAKLERGSPEQQIEAAHALADIGSSSSDAMDALASASRGPDAAVRSAAMQALIRIDRREAVDYLIEAFESRDAGVRMDAAEALSRINTKRAHKALERSQNLAQQSYERARMDEWAEPLLREVKQERKKAYRRHKRIYGDR